MEFNYEKIFKIPLLAMKLNRTDPAVKRDARWLAYMIIVHGSFTFLFLLVAYNVFLSLKAKDFTKTCQNGILSIVYMVITFQYSIMVWKQKHLKKLMDDMKRDYISAKSLPIHEQKIIHEFAIKGNYVCKQWLMISSCGSVSFVVKSAFLMVLYWIVDGELKLIPYCDVVYPSFIEERKYNLIVFSSTYIIFFVFAIYSSFMYCSFIPLGPILVLHACGQLELVRSRIDCLFDGDDLEEVRQKLKDVVKQLQYVYNFVERIQLCFRIAYEMTLKVTTILLPITCFQVIESLKHGVISLEFISFIIGGVLLSSSPCFYSDLLIEKGEDVRMAMYGCGWERVYDRGIRSTIVIVLQRALRPAAIHTLFQTVCLEALAALFQQAYTLFNLMNVAWN